MKSYQTKFISHEITYTGAELRSQFVSQVTGTFASGCIAFCGPCRVPTAELVDEADRRENSFIAAKSMLHFLEEYFGSSLEEAVLRQRLLVCLFAEFLREEGFCDVVRQGDDLYVQHKKLTVSIATATPVSTLVHFGVNIEADGAPVDAIGLFDGFAANNKNNVNVEELAERFLLRWQEELFGVQEARCKVWPR